MRKFTVKTVAGEFNIVTFSKEAASRLAMVKMGITSNQIISVS